MPITNREIAGGRHPLSKLLRGGSLLIALGMYFPAQAQDGSAKSPPERQLYCHNPVAHDGDTLACGAIHIRLQGVDAPEISQKGGKEAKVALSVTWLETAAIVCYPASTDKYGRLIAMCRGQYIPDIGAWLVRHGHAWDYPAYSRGHYADLEAMARADRLGIWKGPDDPIPPWQYRMDRK